MFGSTFRKKRKSKSVPKALKVIAMIALAVLIFGSLGYIAAKVFPVNPSEVRPKTVVAETKTIEEESNRYLIGTMPEDSIVAETAIDSAIIRTFAELGVPRGKIRIKKMGIIRGIGGQFLEITTRISKAIPLALANHRLQSEVISAGGSIIDCVERELGKKIELEIGFSGIATRRLIVVRDQSEMTTGYIALVIDDFGAYPLEESKKFLNLGIPFTASVIPFEKWTKEILDLLSEKNIEVIVHLPMEPEDYPKNDPGANAIYTNLPPSEIKRRVRQAIDAIGIAVGLNNHMGSKATADAKTMGIVADAVSESGLFFIDSKTTIYSCALDKMRSRNIPSTAQDGNIDLQPDTVSVAQKFFELALKSRQTDQGMLIVGHARNETFHAIKRVLPTIEKYGIEFVPASRLVSIRTSGAVGE